MFEEVSIRDPDGPLAATFVPEAGMVGSSIRYDGDELLARHGGREGYRDREAAFGLPFLHPWANRLSAWKYRLGGIGVDLDPRSPLIETDVPTGLPIHGVLHASPHWRVIDTEAGSITAELDFGQRPEYLEAFPFPHSAGYHAAIRDSRLTVITTITPTTDLAVPIAFGFHPYLTLPRSNRREWNIELPVRREGILDDRMIPSGRARPVAPHELDGRLGDRTFDTAFGVLQTSAAGATFVLSDARRRLEFQFGDGYPVAQVYAPTNSDFICFEPMTAPIDALRSGVGLRFAQPGSRFSAAFSIRVR